jgi:cytochrome P450
VIAGNETTTKMLGNARVLLARHPDQRAWLVANPARIADAVEGRVALEEVLPRMPEYAIDESKLVRVHSANVRGYAQVPLRVRG